jgi:CDP-diacylglycerol--glycerol-3-phosphate 3-phosphatidyltransferase
MVNIDYNKVTVIDRFMERTFLKLIPYSVTPNQVTYLRFALTPIVGWLFYKEIYDWGLVLFLLTMLTDALDGAMARTRDQITDLGKIIDPVADKLAIAIVAVLLIVKFLNPLIAWLIVIVDVLIMVVGGYKKYILGKTIQAEIFGKLKLIIQVVGIGILLLFALLGWGWLLILAKVVLYLAIFLAIISLSRPHSI